MIIRYKTFKMVKSSPRFDQQSWSRKKTFCLVTCLSVPRGLQPYVFLTFSFKAVRVSRTVLSAQIEHTECGEATTTAVGTATKKQITTIHFRTAVR